MSNEPIFQKLASEYAAVGKSYERMTAPYLSPVRPLSNIKEPLMDAPVYGPNEHLDGPYRAPLPKRTLSQIIKLSEPDPEFSAKVQESMQRLGDSIKAALPSTPILLGRGIEFHESEISENVVDTVVMRALEPKTELLEKGLAERQLVLYNRMVDPSIQYEIDQEAVREALTPATYNEVVEAMEKIQPAVVLTKTITTEELLEGRTSVDAIQELGQEFAEKYPGAEVLEVNVGERLNGDVMVTVRGILISEEDGTNDEDIEEKYRSAVHAMAQYGISKQTDESVNAASNEENDEDDEPVILTPNFWKISDEE